MNRLFALADFFACLVREADGGGGPGLGGLASKALEGGGDGGGQKPGGGDGGGEQKPGGAEPPAAYYPDGLAESFRGKDNNETIDKLAAHLAGLPKAPEKAADYKYEFPEDFTKQFGDLKNKDDKVLSLWSEAAHKLGLSNEQAQGAVSEFYGLLNKAGLIDTGPDEATEFAKLMPPTGDQKTREIAAARRFKDAEAYVKGLETKGLPKDGAMHLAGLLNTAAGISTLEFLAKLSNPAGLQAGGEGGGSGGPQLSAHEKSMRAMYPSMFKS